MSKAVSKRGGHFVFVTWTLDGNNVPSFFIGGIDLVEEENMIGDFYNVIVVKYIYLNVLYLTWFSLLVDVWFSLFYQKQLATWFS